jgi:hypothetical protein
MRGRVPLAEVRRTFVRQVGARGLADVGKVRLRGELSNYAVASKVTLRPLSSAVARTIC